MLRVVTLVINESLMICSLSSQYTAEEDKKFLLRDDKSYAIVTMNFVISVMSVAK